MTRIPALGPRGEGWVAAQIVLLLAVAVLGARNLSQAEADSGRLALVVVGFVMVSLGAWFVAGGIRDLGRSRTALPYPRDDASLVTTGIYRRVRHPIYVGLIALAVGWACVTLSPLALIAAAVLAVVLDLKARREEVWLATRYPDYPAYQARTNRFIPGVY